LPLVRGSTETADEEIPNFPDAVVSDKTVLCEKGRKRKTAVSD
jgi:hypothetical protein